MTDDRAAPKACSGELIRPNGRVERLRPTSTDPATGSYASERPGRLDADAVKTAARNDRRRRRRPILDPKTGQLIDLET